MPLAAAAAFLAAATTATLAPALLAAPEIRPALRSAAQIPCANSNITNPQADEVIAGQVPIFGSANIDEFNFYKLEHAPVYAPNSWSAVSATINQPVLNGLLDVWDTTALPDGQYSLKLTVVDPAGREVCQTTVAGLFVGNAATPTPSPTITPEESPTPTPTFALESTDEPTEEPTVAPIVPVDARDEPLSANSIRGVIGAFVKGFLAAVIVSAAGLLIVALRR